jgi:hypothetical protein
MAALETRAEIAARGDFYLTPLPMTGATKDQFATWVEDAVTGPRRAELVGIRIGADPVGTGYEFTRNQTAPVDGVERTWSERVQVIRSDSLAATQRVYEKVRLHRVKTLEHQMSHSDVDPRLARPLCPLVVLAQPPVSAQPGERPLYDETPR